jgi:hypothetical protein
MAKIRAELRGVEETGSAGGSGVGSSGSIWWPWPANTNAGKSTLFNRLAEEAVAAKDQPFTTLSPTTRAVAAGSTIPPHRHRGVHRRPSLFLIKALPVDPGGDR